MAGADAEMPAVRDECPYTAGLYPGKGRGATATRDIYAGEVVAVEVPLIVVPLMEDEDEEEEETEEEKVAFCHRCLKGVKPEDEAAMPKCDGCDLYKYCSEACKQKHGTENHVAEVCTALKEAEVLEISDEKRDPVTLLIIMHYFRLGVGRSFEGEHSGKEAFDLVMGLSEDRTVLDDDEKLSLGAAIAFYAKLPSLKGEPMPHHLALSILVKDMQNSFMIASPPRGFGVCSPSLSLFNHECYPNCARIDYPDQDPCEALGPGRSPATVMVRAIQGIKQGSELTISYVPIGYRYSDRSEHIEDRYGIECECDRCRLEMLMEKEEEGEDTCGLHPEGAAGDDAVSPEALYHVFLTRFLCPAEDCRGTLVPIRDTVDGKRRSMLGDIPGAVRSGMECNTCYALRTEEEFERQMADDEC